jgi:hypothetical protein
MDRIACSPYFAAMVAIRYRCPTTGKRIQIELEDDPDPESEPGHEAVPCLACGDIHLIDPKTGKVLSES